MELLAITADPLACAKQRLKTSTGFMPQKIIITFSRKAMEYQRHIRNAQVERAKKILAARDVYEAKKGPKIASAS